MPDMSNPAVMWLVITNFVMAAVVAVCCVLLGGAVVRELLARRARTAASAAVADDHTFHLPELGLTMADGGEREADSKARKMPRGR
jgi:hypothetical protein